MQKTLTALAALALAGCTTTAEGLGRTSIETTLQSNKSAKEFAMCVAEKTPGDTELRDDGTRYWVLISIYDIPRVRWDFIPTEGGSIAELRTTALLGDQDSIGKECA